MKRLSDHVASYWQREGVPAVEAFVRIPSVSPAFAPDWERSGHLMAAVELAASRARAMNIKSMEILPASYPGRTPALLLSCQGTGPGNVLFYGHLDKQPAGDGWSRCEAFDPVIRDDRLYGRGSVDNGYAAFVALGAIAALQRIGHPCSRCNIFLECAEESGSGDLSFYLDRFGERIGQPDLVVVPDSEAGDYEHLWITTSLRGIVSGTMSVSVLADAVHSGLAGGVVPSTFRIMRHLLQRIENSDTGEMSPKLRVPIPGSRIEDARRAAQVLGDEVIRKFPWVDGTRPLSDDTAQLLINNTWHPALEVTGAGGLPSLDAATSTHRAHTQLKLSIRIPPGLDATQAAACIKEALESEPPYGASTTFHAEIAENGWHAADKSCWLEQVIDRAANHAFNRPPMHFGTGGSIPLVERLGARFPEAKFLVTGVAGPGSNSHGPNEFLDLGAARRLTAALAMVLTGTATALDQMR